MSDFTLKNLKEDVEDQAPNFGMEGIEARFANKALDLDHIGLSYQRLHPDTRSAFGHRHESQEEVYVVVGGSGRMKLGDDEVELRRWDAVRVPGRVARCLEGSSEGAEVLAFGAPNTENKDAEVLPGWWAG
jgi:uncharacterized cupin superfamily protein